jgi:hypothetical protein
VSAHALVDRLSERAALGRLVEAVRAGQGRALVVRGDPGMGKTVLLEYLAGLARGCRVARAVGVQSEMELAFAGLHQLCAPMLSRAEDLPAPQRDALRTAFGLAPGPPPDRFLVGLAVLSLLSEVAAERPLICLVDDQQWLDRASAQALGFTARRLAADPVGLVFASRDPGPDLAGLPELSVPGLQEEDARALLESALTGPLDVRVRDLIVAETHGNPLALLELPRRLSPTELAGGFGLPGAAPLAGRIEDSFRRQLDALPEATRRLLQLAAADPSGDRSLVWRAAGRLGIPVQAGAPASEAGLVEFGGQVRFRHPLIRSAAYRSAAFADRQQMHAALAEVTDPITDPDRRAWHRAQAAPGPDEDVAAELEWSAGRAQARGGLAAAAAFLERSLLLTADPARHVERALAAAQASMQAGAFGKALELLAMAESRVSERLDELASARVDLLRGQIVFATSRGSDAPSLLLKAAERLKPLNLDLARETYLSAWMAAELAGHLAGGGDIGEISRAAQALPPPRQPPRPLDLLLDGFAWLVTDGAGAAAPALRQAASAFASAGTPASEVLQYGWMAHAAAGALWDEDRWHALLVRQVRLARTVGALEQLPVDLASLAQDDIRRGDFAGADALIAESDAVSEATGGTGYASYAAMYLAALRGHQAEVTPAGRGHPRRGRSRRARGRRDRHALGHRDPAQRTRALHRRTGRGRTGHPRCPPSRLELGVARADRSRLPQREHPPGAQRPGAAGGEDPGGRDRLRAGHRGTLPRTGQPGPGRRRLLPRGDRAARPHRAPPGPGPRPPALRRMAAPGEPPRGRPGAAAHRLRDAGRDGHGRVCRARRA